MSKKNNSKSCSDNFYSNDDDEPLRDNGLYRYLTTFNATIKKLTKNSDGNHAILWVDPDGRALTVKDDEVKSTGRIYNSLTLLSHFRFIAISCDKYIKVYNVITVNEYEYKGKYVLKCEVEKIEQATGAAAKKATDFSRVKKRDNVSVTLWGNDETNQNEEPEDKETIAELVEKENGLSTLKTALEAAELINVLNDEYAKFTVFAPINSAFNNLPARTLAELLKRKNKAKLAELLKDHVVQGAFTANELSKKSSVRTLSGKKLKVKKHGSKLMVGGVAVQDADLDASNGVVHTVSDVILCTGFYAQHCQ